MEGIYDVYLGQDRVGSAQVERQGLYLRFRCRCALSSDVSRIQVSCGGRTESLGVLLPMGGAFGLDTRLPAKRLGEGEPEFRVIPDKPMLRGRFIPIRPEEPFAYIARLKDAYLAMHQGQIGAMLRPEAEGSAEAPQGSGQTP